MQTLYDLGSEIAKIREAVNQMEIMGQRNATIVVFIHNKCNELIQAINEAAQTDAKIQNGGEEDADGEPDRAATG